VTRPGKKTLGIKPDQKKSRFSDGRERGELGTEKPWRGSYRKKYDAGRSKKKDKDKGLGGGGDIRETEIASGEVKGRDGGVGVKLRRGSGLRRGSDIHRKKGRKAEKRR